MSKKLLRVIFIMVAVFLSASSLVFASNIGGSNSVANLEIDDTDVDFDCEGCDVTVTDKEMQGTIWGESLGWVNLQPADGGVSNTRLGVLSGTGWGATSGWVDFSDVFINPQNGNFSGTANSQNRGQIVFECPGSACVNTDWRPEGCTDPIANNYDDTSVEDDDSCIYIPGCTSSNANNYNPDATIDDGTCSFGGNNTLGCMDSTAYNYNPNANVDNGSCEPFVDGCMDPAYDNYNPEANRSDDSCADGPIEGCMDPAYDNYNPNATVDDGSCGDPPIQGCTNELAENQNPEATIDDGSCVFTDFYGCMDPDALNYDPLAILQPLGFQCEYEGGNGCTDIIADNYNSEATINDGSCTYTIYGCTELYALNYNPFATDDDSSCLFGLDDEGCTNPLAVNYNPNVSIDNGTCIIISGQNEPPVTPIPETDTPETNQPTIGETIENIISKAPGATGASLVIDRYIRQETPLMRFLALALLIASLLQILPLREGNFLLSLFGFYTTKKYWGTVYDSETKQPLDPAYVTLFDDAGQAIDTAITDIDGRYNFIAGPGNYYLSAQKTDYQFPSINLKSKTHDELYTHLYFGGGINITSEDNVLSVNIPMDPLNFNWNEYEKRKKKVTHFYRPWHRVLSVLAKVAFVSGFGLAVWVFVVSPTLFSFLIVSLYVLATVLRLVGFRHLPRGYVKDSKGFAMPFAIVRVYSAELHREVKHTVVGAAGHYLTLVPNGHYYMLIEKKLPSGEYEEVYRTTPFKVRNGFIAKKIKIKE